jgi:hypothetical protein
LIATSAAARAVVVHLTPRRIRIRIQGWERRVAEFATMKRALEQCPGIVSVRVNALVASIVVYCIDGFEIASARQCFANVELVVPVSSPVLGGEAQQIALAGRADRSIASVSVAALAVDLSMAIATRRFEALVIEWLLRAVVRLLLPQLHRHPPPPAKALPLAAAAA